MRRIALTREVGSSIRRCELTHIGREPIDIAVARDQHRRYERCLADLGCRVERLAAEPELPDSVFVEDAAIVLDECAVVLRSGSVSRRPESGSVAAALPKYRERVHRLAAPARMDGGDLLRIGRTLFVGLSRRTDRAGLRQLAEIVRPYGYSTSAVEVAGCLHLKSAVTEVAPGTILLQPDWVDEAAFGGLRRIAVDPTEPTAANALQIGEVVVYPAAHRKTRERLAACDIRTASVDLSELGKAEGGVTCCSLVFDYFSANGA